MTDMALLFSRDPLKLTDEDITEIIKKFREARVSFKQGNMKAGKTTAPKLTKAEAEVKASGLDLSIDLGKLV